MTSGNLGGEPICFTDDDALERLSHLADGWLMHDRAILVPCDDSVVRVRATAMELPIRRSRGYAPLPVALPVPVPPTLAVGADLKNTLAVADGKYAWLSQHIGDMDDLATLSAFDAAQQHLRGADRRRTRKSLVADAHPRTGPPRGHTATPAGRPVRTVQHHHAHIAAVMAEHGLDGSQQVLGFAFDGTGYGPDGAVWGGEVLLADYKGYQRLAQLTYVPLAGGDVSVLRPYRMALAHLWAAGIAWDDGSAAGARPAPPTNDGCCATSSRPGWAACRHPAWAGCSTRCPRSPASGRWSRTRRRRPSSWRAWRATPTAAQRAYAFDVDRSGQTGADRPDSGGASGGRATNATACPPA